jgi:ribulose-5-phosphate 4-epimerase/fuculose-1-phosphate aldolase
MTSSPLEPPQSYASTVADLADLVATACRVLAECGLVEHVLGHISVRVPSGELLVRCRGPRESGLAFTTAEDIRVVPDDLGEWTAPNELPIHTGMMRRRPAVTAVVHAHPPAVVRWSLLDTPLVPLYGAYDIPGARLAAGGIPVWGRSALVRTDELAGELAGAIGDRPVGILRGHGLVSVAEGEPATAVKLAVLQALAVDSLARTSLAVRAAGGRPSPIGPEDLAELPDLGGGFNVETMWRYLDRRAATKGPLV